MTDKPLQKREKALPHVVIIGGGFGGLAAARQLGNKPVRVTLVDERNHHLFQPLLYQVATAGLSGPDIAAPIRTILRRYDNITMLMDRAVAVHADERRVELCEGDLYYDYLVVAAGAVNHYFGHDEWAQYAIGLKSIDEALEIRKRMLFAFEAAERSDDPDEVRRWLTFVVIGGGPTGVEMAGAIAEIAGKTLARDFRTFDPRDTRVVLVEGMDRILRMYTEKLSAKAVEQLEGLGVEIRTGAMVDQVDREGIVLKGGERIEARTVVWGAGVKPSPLGLSIGAPVTRAGHIKVAPDLSCPHAPEIFVIGDMMYIEQDDGTPVPWVAPAAMQSGKQAGRNILRRIAGEPTAPFEYTDKGQMATIGRSRAVAMTAHGRLRFSGFMAWLAWIFVHLFYLATFRNRIGVFFEWAWSYLTFRRSARVIIDGAPEIERLYGGGPETVDPARQDVEAVDRALVANRLAGHAAE